MSNIIILLPLCHEVKEIKNPNRAVETPNRAVL